MVKRFLKRLTARRRAAFVLAKPLPEDFAVIVARRGQRLHNRDRAAAARYERAQLALKQEVTHG